jgi:hypothetical protein
MNDQLGYLRQKFGDAKVCQLIYIACCNVLRAGVYPVLVFQLGSPYGELQQRVVAMLKRKQLLVLEVPNVARMLASLLETMYADYVATDDSRARDWGVGPVLRKFSRAFVTAPLLVEYYPFEYFLSFGPSGAGDESSAEDLQLIKRALESTATKRSGEDLMMKRARDANNFLRVMGGQPKLER